MLDIRLFRERPEEIRQMLRKRYAFELLPLVDKIVALDRVWRENLKKLNELRHKRNLLTRKVAEAKKRGEEVQALIEEAQALTQEIEKIEQAVDELEKEIREMLQKMPNLLDPKVPIGPTEDYSKPIRYWGKPKVYNREEFEQLYPGVEYQQIDWEPKHHYDLTYEFGLADTEAAGNMAGSRFYIEKGPLVILDFAITMYALEKLKELGFELMIPPYLVRGWVENGATYFTAFEDTLYKIEGEDLYLIPTAEHPLAALYANKVLVPEELPIRIGAWSPAFRKEAGAHGKDTKGIFRVHQFHKIEQFSFTLPEDSDEEVELLMQNAESFLKDLELPYRIVIIPSGDMDRKVTIQYDIEVWMPAQNRYRELGSYGNVTDWQARRMNIRVRRKGKLEYVHTIYATGIAVQRTITAIMENHYDPKKDVIRIPRCLWKYTMGLREIRKV